MIAALWGGYQILTLTFTHFLAFALVGVIASLLFDWSRPGGLGRIALVTFLCTVAFFATIALSGSMVALGSVGTGLLVGVNVLGAAALAVFCGGCRCPRRKSADWTDLVNARWATQHAQPLRQPRSASSGRSRTTSVASLSSRSPRKRGWRSRPCSVHSVNPTSATSSGVIQ